MAREPNTAVVLHTTNNTVLTLDLCLQLGGPGTPLWRKSMARDENEVATKTIERLQVLLAQTKEGKTNKRTSREELLKNAQPVKVLGEDAEGKLREEDEIEKGSLRGMQGRMAGALMELNALVPNKVFWKRARQIQIGSCTVTVKYNVPTITSVVPPSALYVGVPAVCGDVTVLFATETEVQYEWYLHVTTEEPVATGVNLRVLSRESVFTPLPEHRGQRLLLRLLPGKNSPLYTEVELPPVADTLPPMDRWKCTKTALEAPAFRVVTYNVLHDEFCSSGAAKRRIYPFATDDILSLKYRQTRIVQELLAYNADLICMQECGMKVYKQFFARILHHHGYVGCYTNKNGGVREGCACFWREDRFKLKEKHEFPLNWSTIESDHPELASAMNPYAELKDALEHVTSIGVVLLLTDERVNQELVVGNTHLFYHANACHIRLLQAFLLLHRLKSVAGPSSSVLLCGDFNMTHTTGGYRLVTNGRTESTHHSWKKGEIFYWGGDRMLGVDAVEDPTTSLVGEISLAPDTDGCATSCADKSDNDPAAGGEKRRPPFSAYSMDIDAPIKLCDAYGLTEPDMPWTNYAMTFREVIDYIFFSPERLSVIRTVPIPPESDVSENIALPNRQFPSDHLALIADLVYKLPS
ncbi:hypothetical protein TRVL_01517 [Trypanosoma vivax]|nr:hypothetical protein TRVL_01517 [Trypanosoma vivax]